MQVDRLVRELDGSIATAATSVGALGLDVPVLESTLPIPAVDDLLRRDASIRGLITSFQGSWHFLGRARLEHLLTGRSGYGRALRSRDTLASLIATDTLVLDADTQLASAATLLLQRASDTWVEDLVVVHVDRPQAVPVSAVFAHLAVAYRRAALTDALTGLPNRQAVHEYLAENPIPGTRDALLYVDLDGFKEVNDTFGHAIGDALLSEFADRLRAITRKDDVVARLGGDEFVILLTDIDEATACAVADRVVLAGAAPYLLHSHVVTAGSSAGLALAADPTPSASMSASEQLMHHADLALYRAKSDGRGRWARLDGGGDEIGPPMARRLKDALDTSSLHLHYQAKVDVASGALVEVEALCRWTDADLGSVSPAEFIPLAESTGLIVRLGRWVLAEACAQGRAWLDQGHELRVAVNISPLQLSRPGFVSEVKAVLDVTGLPADRLRLELTETAAVRDPLETARQLAEVRALGVMLSLDDFGTGFSSLTLLRLLPVHTVKIDRSFVDRIDVDSDDATLVEMIIDTAHRLRLTVVAEGVERQSQYDQLGQLGCDAAQGFLLGRPLPADRVLAEYAVRR